jgi:hypothetical protein
LLEDGVAEQGFGFFCVGGGGLFEENVFAGAEALEGPFVVETIREGVVNTIYGWVVDEV